MRRSRESGFVTGKAGLVFLLSHLKGTNKAFPREKVFKTWEATKRWFSNTGLQAVIAKAEPPIGLQNEG